MVQAHSIHKNESIAALISFYKTTDTQIDPKPDCIHHIAHVKQATKLEKDSILKVTVTRASK